MSPITAQQAWDATDPSQPEDERKAAAQRMMLSVAANDAYLSSRGELEQLVARARGEQIVSHSDLNSSSDEVGSGETRGEIPTESGPQTVDGTVVEGSETSGLPSTSPEAENIATGSGGLSAASGSPGPDNATETVSTLRAQLQKAGIEPEA